MADAMECRQSIRKMLLPLLGGIAMSAACVVMLILLFSDVQLAPKSSTPPPKMPCETETFQLYFGCKSAWYDPFAPGGAMQTGAGAPGDATPADPPPNVDTSLTWLFTLAMSIGFLICLLFFVPATLMIMLMLATHAFRRKPTLVISPTGLLDRRMVLDEIPWSWIQDITLFVAPHKTVWLVLEFRTGYEQMVRLSRYGKFCAWLKRKVPAFDQGGLPIDIGQLDVDPEQIGETILKFYDERHG